MTSAPPHQDERPVWEQKRAERRREPSFKRLILNLITLALVVGGISFFAAPLVTFYGIRAAAQAGDVQGLAKLIDYDAVRGALRLQLSGRVQAQTPAPSILQDPIGAIRRQFDQTVAPVVAAGPDVEGLLAPRALEALTYGYGRGAASVARTQATLETTGRSGRPWPRYWSVNRARVAVRASTGTDETLFTFERRGPFEWKLVHIGLPPQIEAGSTPSRAAN